MIPGIWERYFYKEIGKIFFLFLACFYSLYILIDFSSQMSSFFHKGYSWFDIAKRYSYIFVQRADILVPFAFLIASIKTLAALKESHALIALRASGIPLKVILQPFLRSALLLVGLLYFSFERILPPAMDELEQMQAYHAPLFAKESIKELQLENGDKLLYQSFNSFTNTFFDVYWIRSIDDIYHIKYLIPDSTHTEGRFVDHFQRDPATRKITIGAYYPLKLFPELSFKVTHLKTALTPPQFQPLSKLWQQLPRNWKELTDQQAEILTAFCFKMLLPWLSLFALIMPAPYLVKSQRLFSPFPVYALSIFSLLAFYLLLDAATILAETRVLHPFTALLIPSFCIYAFVFYFWIKERR
ncbi:MAG: hypothetical protein K0S07_227 [Chlamydiales bacterium]|jgi:lipopolysaccharide export system permease protein|nr:hypothetical protein [Chlamydiales bacterium]